MAKLREKLEDKLGASNVIAIYPKTIKDNQTRRYHVEVEFKCKCGGSIIRKASDPLKKDREFKCRTCYLRDLSANKSDFADVAKACLLSRYKKIARYRNLKFELTKEQFGNLLESMCHYCGVIKSNTFKSTGRPTEAYKYNGIDRKDNTIGYRPDNVVSCCILCNRGKNNADYSLFIDHIKNIIKYNLGRASK